jgi:hypothetical protein
VRTRLHRRALDPYSVALYLHIAEQTFRSLDASEKARVNDKVCEIFGWGSIGLAMINKGDWQHQNALRMVAMSELGVAPIWDGEFWPVPDFNGPMSALAYSASFALQYRPMHEATEDARRHAEARGALVVDPSPPNNKLQRTRGAASESGDG